MRLDEAAYKRLIRGQTRGVAASLARAGLRLLSAGYAFATGCRNVAFDRGWRKVQRVSVPVVSVGNLTVGGTGKTPTVEWIANWFRRHNVRVAILSRGYGAADGPNDEALVLEQNLADVPHLQGADRVALARTAIERFASQALILDDGFQHRRLGRDLDIVLLDATCPFGEGRQLPAGLLRESPRGLRRADVVLLTRCDAVDAAVRAEIRERVRHYAGDIAWAECRFLPTRLVGHGARTADIERIAGAKAYAFCGIGNPEEFWRTLTSLGVDVRQRRALPDHHRYTRSDVAELTRWARDGRPEIVLTTQKDLVKFRDRELGGAPLWAVGIEARIEGGADRLDEVLASVVKKAASDGGAPSLVSDS